MEPKMQSINNLNLGQVETFKFDGIDEENKVSKIFNHKGELVKKPSFKNKSIKRILQSNKKLEASKEKHKAQFDLSQRRAEIITQENTPPARNENDTGNKNTCENQLIELLDCNISEKHVSRKGLKKQINKDIKTYFSNNIQSANTPDRLLALNSRIESMRGRVNSGVKSTTIDSLKKLIDTQCDIVCKNLKNHLKSVNSSSISRVELITLKAQYTIKWTKTIQEISEKSFKTNKTLLTELLCENWNKDLLEVKAHDSNLKQTISDLNTIKETSKHIISTLRNTLKDKSNLIEKLEKNTNKTENKLNKQLDKTPNLVTDYREILKEIDSLNDKLNNTQEFIKEFESNLNKHESEVRQKKADAKQTGINKNKFLRNINPNYRNISNNKSQKKLKQQLKDYETEKAKLNSEIKNKQKNLETLGNQINAEINTYKDSIKDLPIFHALKNNGAKELTIEQLISCVPDTNISNKPAQGITAQVPANERNTTASETATPPKTTVQHGTTPPPPPPPPPVGSEGPEKGPETPTNHISSNGQPKRSDLLAQIQKGITLKPVKANPSKVAKDPQNSDSSTPPRSEPENDLIASLNKKINERNQAIQDSDDDSDNWN